jgi:biopolymer transport protein ExbB
MIEQALDELSYYVGEGGLVMWPLIGGTFVLWYALGFRLFMLRRGNPRSVRVLVERYARGYRRPPSGVVDTAVVRGLELANQTSEHLRKFLDDAFEEIEAPIRRYARVAKTIVIIAPLAGLLGTVSGMIEMFDSLASQTFLSQSGGIARGISEALFTTQMGLAVAVPGLIVGRILERKQERIEMELVQLKDILCATNKGSSVKDGYEE